MRGVIPRYLLQQFWLRAFLVTLGLAGVLLVFDLLGNIVAVTANHKKSLGVILSYVWLRLPAIVLLALPVGVLLAAMITLGRLAANREMTALAATGRTIYFTALVLMAGALVPSGVQVWLSNSVAPVAQQRLDVWSKNDYRGHAPTEAKTILPAWFVAGSSLVRVADESGNGAALNGITIIRRDGSGVMTDYITAAQARYGGGVWHLTQVTHKIMGQNGFTQPPTLDIALPLDPDVFALAGMNAAEMGLPSLWRAYHSPDIAAEPRRAYRLGMERKFAEPLEGLIMVLLAAPLGLQVARRNAMFSLSFGIIAAGFLYFVIERLLLSLGETGALPPVAAVWTPVLVFGMTGAWYLLYKQEGKA